MQVVTNTVTLLINGCSEYWADYRKNSKKAKVHVGFDLNRAIPRKVFLTDGNGAERPFVTKLFSDDQTGVTDRGYQCHKRFDQWQDEGKKFICRIKASTKKTIWDIENFFAWWKRHLKVYHLIARSEHGLMVQILAGLITYLLLSIYCHQKYNEKVTIKRVRQLGCRCMVAASRAAISTPG